MRRIALARWKKSDAAGPKVAARAPVNSAPKALQVDPPENCCHRTLLTWVTFSPIAWTTCYAASIAQIFGTTTLSEIRTKFR